MASFRLTAYVAFSIMMTTKLFGGQQDRDTRCLKLVSPLCELYSSLEVLVSEESGKPVCCATVRGKN